MIDENDLVRLEMERHDWNGLLTAGGSANAIPSAVWDLLSAKSPEQVDQAYWKLENEVVLQGKVFSSAPRGVSVVLAALTSPSRPRFVRMGLLELLFQIVKGSVDFQCSPPEMARIEKDCLDAARDGLWLLYHEAFYGVSDAAVEILRLVEGDDDRLRPVIDYLTKTRKLSD